MTSTPAAPRTKPSRPTPPNPRTAVDRNAEDYWTKYFKDYGRQWCRKIPRRVAKAVQEEITRVAQRTAQKVPALHVERIQPWGFAERADGGLDFEGLVTLHVAQAQSTKPKAFGRAFIASFSPEGALLKFESSAL
jgi:hypothetical protein